MTWSTSTYRARVTGTRTIDSGEPFIQTDALPGEAGQQISARIRVTNLTSGNRPMRLQISAFSSTDGSGDTVGRSDLINTQVPAGAGVDLLLDGYALPTGSRSYRLKAVTSYTTITAGVVVELDNALVEVGPAAGPYFDGGTTPTTNAFLPYLSDGATGSLRYDLQADGGTTQHRGHHHRAQQRRRALTIAASNPLVHQTFTRDRGATGPLLVIAAIAVTLVLLVGGSFAVAGLISNSHDTNARADLEKAATAEQGVAAVGRATYSWTGAENASASVERSANGTRTNEFTNPSFTTGTTSWAAANGLSISWDGANRRAQLTSGSNLPSGTSFMQSAALPGTAGERISTRVHIHNPGAAVRTMRAQVNGLPNPDGTGASLGNSMTSNVAAAPGGGVDLIVDGYELPPGSKSYKIYLVTSSGTGNTIATGDVFYVDEALAEKALTAGDFFNGSGGPASRTHAPYLSGSDTARLGSDLSTGGGTTPATWLARQGIGFTPSDGVRTAVLTTSAGDGWVAVSKSQTGKVFIHPRPSNGLGRWSR